MSNVKYNIEPLISDELVKKHCCKVFVNATTGECAYDQTDTTIEGQRNYYNNPSEFIPAEAIFGGLNVVNRCAIDINKQFINQSGSVEWCNDGVYSKGARVKKTTTNNVIYYISQKDKNTDALTTPNWKIDHTAFDFTDFTCNNSALNIKLTHKGQMKFVSDYLHNGLHIVFIANKTNTSAISSIEIDGVSVGLCDNNDNYITPTQIQKDTIIELFYSELFEKFVYFPKKNKISGEFFTTAQKSTKISGCVPCLGQELDKEVYATLWKMLGISGRNTTDTTSGVCYTGSGGALFYIRREDIYTIDDNLIDKDGNIIAEYLYSDKYCTQPVGMVKTLTDTTLTLQNGSIYTRYKLGDKGTTFRVPDLRGGVPFGANNVNELMVLSNGKIPNLTGKINSIQFNGFNSEQIVNAGTGIFKASNPTAPVGLTIDVNRNANADITLDASTSSNVYTNNYNKVSPAGIGTIWFIQV